MKRKEFILGAIPAVAGLSCLSFTTALPDPAENDEELLSQVKLLQELDNDAFGWIWSLLKGISDEELDWKINKESNSIRWIIGHLTWFEEWACDAINETGLYLIEKQPSTSFQSDSLDEMKKRFTRAHDQYNTLVGNLTAEQVRRPSQYLYNDHNKKRADVDLRTILGIHSTHFYGHLYQIRMIRGTYSRINKTNKAEFDKW
ncbi:DinB family protein [Lentiprolixibacter aurantiacus]|uniref:DinB family protein n=1 Tax=Lentiprolixibacter aurantiacus TaxID=2993939 RepID=A0AAE3SPC8_9FLAO|nr:DinB family protein [Lentiprolixibacter aurantiacus]MCX2720554.1 DinB family protein [Lentiprolixibacter aurantiacus]